MQITAKLEFDHFIEEKQSIVGRKSGSSIISSKSAIHRTKDPLIKKISSISHLQFNQAVDLDYQDPLLQTLDQRFNGLCDLICNKILLKDLLGKAEPGEKGAIFFKKKLQATKLDKLAKSHILMVYSKLELLVAFLFHIFPDNLFSITEQWRLVHQVALNSPLFAKGLSRIQVGETVKVQIFKRTWRSFHGHSLLIQKIDPHSFILFDPNQGELRGLNESQLKRKINFQLKQEPGSKILFIKAKPYLQRIEKRYRQKTN